MWLNNQTALDCIRKVYDFTSFNNFNWGQAFANADVRGQGTLHRSEFIQLLQQHMQVSEGEVAALIDVLSPNWDEQINYSVFQQALFKFGQTSQEELHMAITNQKAAAGQLEPPFNNRLTGDGGSPYKKAQTTPAPKLDGKYQNLILLAEKRKALV